MRETSSWNSGVLQRRVFPGMKDETTEHLPSDTVPDDYIILELLSLMNKFMFVYISL